MTTIIRGIKELSELQKLFSFYNKVFIKTPLVFFTKRIINDPYLFLDDIRIAEENNEITGSVTVFRRNMYWKNKVIAFGGIGNVSTLPEKRSCGIATKTMQDAISYIENIPFDITILFTGINSFYERFNFFTIPTYYLTFHITDIQKSEYQIRFFSESDLDIISTIYDSFNKNLYGPVIRDIDYWHTNLGFAEEDEIFLIAEKQNLIEGYIRFVPSESKNEIWEFGYTNIEAFNALLIETAKRLNKKDLKTAALCPSDLVTNNSVFGVSYEPTDIAMALCSTNRCNSKFIEEFKNYCFWWTDNF